MTDIDSVEHDEFECSECDFKCSSESDMIEHSSIHQRPNNNNDSVSNILPNENTIKNDSVGIDNVINLHTNFNCKKESDECTNLEQTTEMKNPWIYESIVKIEPSLLQKDYKSDNCHKIEIRNEEIKFEHNDHHHEILPNFLTHEINGCNNIKQEQTSKVLMHQLQNSLGLIGSSTAHIDNNDNISTYDDTFGTHFLNGMHGSLFSQCVPLQNDSSKDLPSRKRNYDSMIRSSSIEVEVDNTNIYIPPGWKRKAYMGILGNALLNGQIKYICHYYTEMGKRICSQTEAYEYVIKYPLSNIDIEKLDFSTIPITRNPFGIYIPDGWQRKITVSTNSNSQKQYHITYLNSDGKGFGCKSEVYAYLPHSTNIRDTYIDVEKMNFSVPCQFSLAHSKAEKDKNVDYLFDVRKIKAKTISYNLYLCKLCNYSFRGKNNACDHASTHVQTPSKESIPNNDLPNKYDHFMCTVCHIKIMRRNDLQVHVQRHLTKQIFSTVVGVKFVYGEVTNYKDSNHRKCLFCCEVCNVASSKYSVIVKHLKIHTFDEINSADIEKYYKHINGSEENTLKYKCVDSHDNEQNNDNSYINFNKHDKPHNERYIGGPTIDQTTFRIEINVNNTGIYIPKGWQRKVYKYTKGIQKGKYVVKYISPFGKMLYNKIKVLEYIEQLESDGIDVITEPIKVQDMDFSCSSHNLHNIRKVKNGRSFLREGVSYTKSGG
ncbi:unnamed protein product [Meganyctiphanes norvegica]|uniref:Uncharacterized protein n=1 Tax=Meganyctiphanes norvegica TaxID=48144 RepID=A0AAV2Q155_MEGNR